MTRTTDQIVEDAQTAILINEGVLKLKAENSRLRGALEAIAMRTSDFDPATDELRRIALAALYPSER